MKTQPDQLITLNQLVDQLKRYAPWIPAIIATHFLSRLVADSAANKNIAIIQSIFGRGIAIPALLLLAYVSLKDMRDTTSEEFKNELKSYVGISKYKDQTNPFTIIKIGGLEGTFTNIDLLADFLGTMRVSGTPDRASRSFDAALRTVIMGWADPYLLRAAEFMAVRSVEQSMHEIFPGRPPKNAHEKWVTAIRESYTSAFKEGGEPKPITGAEDFNAFLHREIPEIDNPYSCFEQIVELRRYFAHRDEAENCDVYQLDLAPFQLARVCLQYRSEPRP